ncbi:DUF2252 domain-containing protein [Pseudomonas plecoglossicida]|uniref:DUF2252 domain-containing protein n=1 Tax=Pseudomonas plecoglossicida TaxID=70775 RepID=A0A0B5K5W3_PSEDL|nr:MULTISPECIES: DUF2252 domain-containing protein [Pseudomonas]MDY4310125.1 DUF2252 domain-containing protein [Pseudomonas putida]AJG13964.1 hypothetical protein RK21_02456 [Pseudomonas plecoglossicida]MBF8786562.1 DUF2252 domain-containing protein [Pseudomonas asiatica]MDY4319953.1 DUF2252 domain-containing protein [Pseudomonas putida]MDY4353093.1 DUF2252 domain-containing protein [Pseudomonas putida]
MAEFKKRSTKRLSRVIDDIREDKNFHSLKERLEAGKRLRDVVPRAAHATWKCKPKQRDPVGLLELSNRDRHPALVPVRYGRMLRSSFTFLRGSAGLMARDLATLPCTGVRVQACGDCHLLNFGLFATPERNLIFDINDFDETLPAPWEWDIKRLAVSFAVAAQDNRLNDKEAGQLAMACVQAYRKRMRELSEMSPLDVWYDRLDAQAIIDMAPSMKYRKARQELIARARTRIGDYLYPQISDEVGGRRRLVDQPPILFHIHEAGFAKRVKLALEDYRSSLLPERRFLYDRYRLEDFAVKAVGIGSVGTFCFVGLFFSAENHPLLLQFKEACPSVLAPYAGKSEFANQGQRVVTGQRLSQSASDIFLGWTESSKGRQFFVRQLRDMKMSLPVEGASFEQMNMYAQVCGMTLARAHAKSGDAALISGYLGKSDAFDQALGKFALAYAEQNARYHAALVNAEKKGRIKAFREEDD